MLFRAVVEHRVAVVVLRHSTRDRAVTARHLKTVRSFMYLLVYLSLCEELGVFRDVPELV